MKSISTDIKLRGDKIIEQIPSIKDKALRINLNENIYGTFAEIGAGQETVRHFFRAGGASGSIAKTMSAYDKDFSDAIYGKEVNGRYVCESRLKKMIEHESSIIEQNPNAVPSPKLKELQKKAIQITTQTNFCRVDNSLKNAIKSSIIITSIHHLQVEC